MTERLSGPDQSTERGDIAALYARAHIEGARYWDFSASSKQVRGLFRRRTVREPSVWIVPPAAALPAHAPQQPVEPPQFQVAEMPPPQVQQPPETQPQVLQSSEAAAPRWYALHSVFSPAADVAEETPEEPPICLDQRPPTLVVFSLAGGVGKTCLVATLGRALSAFGEHLLLADTAACGLLPLYFGSHEFRPGVVRTFSPPGSPFGAGGDAPVQLLNLQAERYPRNGSEQDPFLTELLRDGRGAGRILVDVATGSRELTSRLLQLRPTVLVPLLPDLSSVACLGLLDILLADPPSQVLFLLNQFDASLPLHLDLRAMLQQQLGDRLLPFVLRRSSAVSEALAEGMTVIDYAPDSPAAEDYRTLAGWLCRFEAPAVLGHRGNRWSER